jgi:hypothetical protein
MITKTFIGLLLTTITFAAPLLASGGGTPELNVALSNAISKLDREAAKDAEGPMLLAVMLQKEFGTPGEELKWGMEQKIGWGDISALAYIQATTGKSFARNEPGGCSTQPLVLRGERWNELRKDGSLVRRVSETR